MDMVNCRITYVPRSFRISRRYLNEWSPISTKFAMFIFRANSGGWMDGAWIRGYLSVCLSIYLSIHVATFLYIITPMTVPGEYSEGLLIIITVIHRHWRSVAGLVGNPKSNHWGGVGTERGSEWASRVELNRSRKQRLEIDSTQESTLAASMLYILKFCPKSTSSSSAVAWWGRRQLYYMATTRDWMALK